MRLFTAIDVPYEMRRNLELLLHLLRPKASLQWSPLDNLHITTKFIGDFPAARLPELKAALAAIPHPGPLRIAIRGLGWFPNPRAPRVFFAAIEAPPELEQLARATEAAGEPLGIPAENRPFRPHLTLARVRQPVPLGALQDAIAALPNTDFGAFTAAGWHLYQSVLASGGSIYTKLASFLQK